MKIRGVEINLHGEGEALSDHIRREKDFFEAEILDYIVRYHPDHCIIIDVGANIGNHTLYFAHFLNYELIWAFEPIAENYNLLRKNITSFYPEVLISQQAISSSDNGVRISPNYGNMGASQVSGGGAREVESITLDSLFAESNVTLIKIDVEEYEPEVLAGAVKTIQHSHPLILIEDWHDEYAKLLPDYVLEKGWPEHHTFLYRWKNA